MYLKNCYDNKLDASADLFWVPNVLKDKLADTVFLKVGKNQSGQIYVGLSCGEFPDLYVKHKTTEE